MVAVIVPAHNEEAVIGRTVSRLLQHKAEADEVIVVSNGSTDATVAVARAFEPSVTVVALAEASKTRALNAGDLLARSFPRVYLDADVEVHPGTLARLATALDSGLLAAGPEPRMDVDGASWAVRAYYRVWFMLPYCRRGMIGGGVYALSEAGRRRFDRFPDLIADDGFVRALFKEHERGLVRGAYVTLRAPKNLRWLLKIKVRSRLGRMQLGRHYPELLENERKEYGRGLREVLRNPLNWPAAFVYLYVSLLSRLRARRLSAGVTEYQWQKDESSRNAGEVRSV